MGQVPPVGKVDIAAISGVANQLGEVRSCVQSQHPISPPPELNSHLAPAALRISSLTPPTSLLNYFPRRHRNSPRLGFQPAQRSWCWQSAKHLPWHADREQGQWVPSAKAADGVDYWGEVERVTGHLIMPESAAADGAAGTMAIVLVAEDSTKEGEGDDSRRKTVGDNCKTQK